MKKNTNNKLSDFFLLGTIGCLLEILFTAVGALRYKDYHLKGSTSLWMFPIYGLGCLIHPIEKFLRHYSWIVRGSIYALAIYITEFLSGIILNKMNCCPWNYEHSKYNLRSVIRLDYFPCWFLTGLLFEKILKKSDRKKESRA